MRMGRTVSYSRDKKEGRKNHHLCKGQKSELFPRARKKSLFRRTKGRSLLRGRNYYLWQRFPNLLHKKASVMKRPIHMFIN